MRQFLLLIIFMLFAIPLTGIKAQNEIFNKPLNFNSTKGKIVIPNKILENTIYRPNKITEHHDQDSTVYNFEYDSNSRIQFVNRFNRDYNDQILKNFRRDEFDYSGEPNFYTFTEKYISQDFTNWLNETMTEYYYNENHQISEEINKVWQLDQQIWKPGSNKMRYEYYPDGKLYRIIVSMYIASYIDIMRATYNYDSNGNIIEALLESIDFGGTAKNSYKTIVTYDSKGRILTSISYEWNIFDWKEHQRDTYTYDDQNNTVVIINEVLDFNTQNFANNTKDTEVYDAQGNVLSTQHQIWDNVNNVWNPGEKFVYTYSNSGKHVKIDYLLFTGADFEPATGTKTIFYNEGKNDLYLTFKSLEIDFTSSTTDVENENNSVPKEFALNQNYPNPFNPRTAISYQLSAVSKVELKVYDMLGKEISTLVNEIQSAGSYKINFNASNLSSGVYIYQIKADNFVQSKKMMLVK